MVESDGFTEFAHNQDQVVLGFCCFFAQFIVECVTAHVASDLGVVLVDASGEGGGLVAEFGDVAISFFDRLKDAGSLG